VVITGLSGSGKSSLAFDTIYAEGQRRYVESLSAYARQFLDMMEKPDVDHISGLSPAISIEQKTTSKNPRSTVGTVTEIYDYLRLLFARVGTPYSPATGQPIEAQQVQDMVDRVMAMEEGTRAYLLAPIVRDRKGEYRKEFLELRKQGFQRVKVDGEFYELDAPPTLDKKFRHDIDVVVDRIVVREGLETRLADSFRTALDLADGIAILETAPKEGRSRAHHLLRELRLPGLRLHHPRDRAAAVLLQRALRRLPRLRRAGGGAVLRRTPHGARCGAQPRRRRHRALAQGQVALFPADDRGHREALRVRPQGAWKDLPRMCSRSSCAAPARRKSSSATTRAAASTR
jgi:excinuclease ABC A subunit